MGSKTIIHTWKDRKEKRFKEENKVIIEWANYEDPEKNNVIYAFTQDLSIGGAKILTDINFPVDTTFVITITLSRSRQSVTLEANVRWVNPAYDGDLFEVGLEFIHDLPQTIACLFKHLYEKDLRPSLAEKIVEVEKDAAHPAR